MINRYLLLIFLILFFEKIPAQSYELQSITFEGNEKIPSSTLETVILSEETPAWFWKFLNSFTALGDAPVYFDSTKIPTDINSLRLYYLANGFFNTSFSYKYELDTTDEEAYLTYIVSEGEPSTYGHIKLEGLQRIGEPTINYVRGALAFDQKAQFTETGVQQKVNNALEILQNSGHMLAEFDSSIVYRDTTDNKANLELFFSPGQRYIYDSVEVIKTGEGAEDVEEELIREITYLKKGDVYDRARIRRRQQNLIRTGIFNSVSISGNEADTSGYFVPLVVETNIGLMNELSPEIIMNMQQNVFNIGLGANYIRKNFLGGARRLTVGASFGIQNIFKTNFDNLINKFSFRDTSLLGYVDARVVIEHPFLNRRPIFSKLENYATINKLNTSSSITVYGSKLTLEFELPRYTFITFLSTSYNVEVSNEFYRISDSISNKLISIIGAEFGSTNIDNILFPTRGYNLSFQIEEANSLPYLISKSFGSKEYSGALFYKLVTNNSVFGSFGKKRNYIFAGKLKLGYMQTFFGDYADIPLNRTFYAGGSNSIRGWEANELVPEDAPPLFDPNTGEQEENFKGGTFLVEGSLEFRLRFMESIGTALFVDYGNTWLGYKSFRFDKVAIAAGIGFRYYTSIAPFRIDFGFKFYDPSDKTFIFNKHIWKNMEFHFGIGEAF